MKAREIEEKITPGVVNVPRGVAARTGGRTRKGWKQEGETERMGWG